MTGQPSLSTPIASPTVDARPAVSHMVVTPTKSVGVAILVTLFFGPLGLFYASVAGALVVLFGSIAAGVALMTLGLSGHGSLGALAGLGLLLPVAWITSLVWGIVAVNSYNARLLGRTS